MQKPFDPEEAKRFLAEREEKQKSKQEEERKLLLERVIHFLQEEFKNSSVEAYLVGSIIQPFAFAEHSDVDIVLKNYSGDRFDFWTKVEEHIQRKVEVILFEQCHFQEFITKNGLKVI